MYHAEMCSHPAVPGFVRELGSDSRCIGRSWLVLGETGGRESKRSEKSAVLGGESLRERRGEGEG